MNQVINSYCISPDHSVSRLISGYVANCNVLATLQSVMCLFYNHLFNEASEHYNVVL